MKNYMFLNRPPTLWRHSMPLVEVVPTDDESIHMNPLILEPFNADFDGDALMVYAPHDNKSIEDSLEKAFYANDIFYDRNGKFLSTLRHEALYGAYILTDKSNINNIIIGEYNNLEQLPINYNWLNDKLYDQVKVDNNVVTYGIAVFNKLCGFNQIKINYTITKKTTQKVSEDIFNDSKDNFEYYKRLNFLMQNMMVFITVTKHCPSIDIDTIVSLVDDELKEKFHKLPKENIYLGYAINQGLIDRILQYKIDKNSELYKLYICGARFSKTQLARFAINIGYFADANNYIFQEPICSSLTEGTSEKEFFMSCYGARKAIRDKSFNTPKSGALERTMVMALSILEVDQYDCGTDDLVEVHIFSEDHAKSLVGKYAISKNEIIINKLNWKADELNLITKDNYKYLINEKILMRSPLTCKTKNNRVCRVCAGHVARDKKYIGVIAGQCLMENFTQLVLRTFHTSGAAELKIEDANNDLIIEIFRDYYIDHEEDDKMYIVKFKSTCENLNELAHIPGFVSISENGEITEVYFEKQRIPVKNLDIISSLEKLNNIIKTEKSPAHPLFYYHEMIKILLSTGQLYSTYVELLLCNMFLTETGEYWRYCPSENVSLKVGIRSLAKTLSPVLGFLYQPNVKTIDFDITENAQTIYEKILMNKL